MNLLELQDLRKSLNENIQTGNIKIYNTIEDKNNDHISGAFEYEVRLALKDKKLPKDFSNTTIIGEFNCSNTYNLTSLERFPHKIVGDLYLTGNSNLTSLEHAPKIVDGGVYFYETSVKSLSGIGKDYLLKIGGELWIPLDIKSNILGVLKIKDLNKINLIGLMGTLSLAMKIINKHLEDRDIVKCKNELIEAGYKEFAKL